MEGGLVLTRSMEEKIVIGKEGEIIITVVQIDGRNGRVRLHIVAPRDVPIDRKEIWDRIQVEGRKGSKS